ncbi:MAG: energy transducer TonB [Butyricimonas synergistica]|nr:MAG: energy transducer TonB [Butyricimonas synergistica]
MAKDINVNSVEWCDLIFEGKNKDYGAYELRKYSPRRHLTAYVVIIGCVVLAMVLPAFVRFLTPVKAQEKMVTVTELSDLKMDLPEVKEENKIVAVNVPPPPTLKTTIKFTAPVIKKDEEVREEDEIKTQDEVNQAKAAISVADVKGNDEENGKDIADLEDHKLIVASEDEVFQVVEQAPEYPGGMAALMKWIGKEIKYPSIAQEMNIEGRVIVQFVIGRDGSVRDVQVLRTVDPTLDKEAVRVVKAMRKWIPGRQRGEPVSVRFTLPITFKLQQ